MKVFEKSCLTADGFDVEMVKEVALMMDDLVS